MLPKQASGDAHGSSYQRIRIGTRESSMEVREVPRLAFTEVEVAAFAPLNPVLAEVAWELGLEWSRVRDRDPVNPYAAHYLSWRGNSPSTGGRCWICVRARDPCNFGPEFVISLCAGSECRDWDYSAEEGTERLRELLELAHSLATEQSDTSVGAGYSGRET